jgi:predicted MFS family arabinose efflux permease
MAEANGRSDAELLPGGDDASRLTRREWVLLLVLAAVQFTNIMDFVILMPLGPELTSALKITAAEFGWIVSAYGFSACLFGLLAAWYLDRFDRKSALLVLYAGFAVGTLFCAAAPNYPLLVVARAVAGGFGGVMGTNVLAIVGDVFPDARRATAMGVVMSAFSVASILGIPFGIFLANYLGWRLPFGLLGLISAAVLLLAGRILPPLRSHLGRGAGPALSVWRVLIEPAHLRAYVLSLVLVLSGFTIGSYLSLYLVNNAGMDKRNLPLVWLCGGAATLLTTPLVGRIADRFGKLRVFRIAAVAAIVPALLITNLSVLLIPDRPLVCLVTTLLVTTLFMVLSSGRMVPAMALITGCAQPAYRGSFLSVSAAVQQLAIGVAPLAAAALMSEAGEGQPLVGFPRVGLAAATAMVLSIVLAGRLRPAVAPLADAVGEPHMRVRPEAAVESVQA